MTPGHVCRPPFQPKANGLCLCCREPTYEVKDVYAEGPLEGTPRRLGHQLEEGTQVTFRLSDGSSVDISFCIDCAASLKPAHYMAVWRAIAEREEISMRMQGRSRNEQLARKAAILRVWPMAVTGKRREGVEPGVLIVDRR